MCITTIGCFGGKAITDININITAVGLLWNVADFLAKEHRKIDFLAELLAVANHPHPSPGSPTSANHTHSQAKGSVGAHLRARAMSTAAIGVLPSPASGDSHFPTPPTSASLGLVDSLWVAVFQELWARADNRRAEIRNCALQTLYSTLTTYGSTHLTKATWSQVVEQVLIPSVDWVLKNADKADRAVVSAVHHSRNSEAKQWHETQVIVLTGNVRVFKSFFDIFAALPAFDKAWRTLVGSVDQFFASDPEVALVRLAFHSVPSFARPSFA